MTNARSLVNKVIDFNAFVDHHRPDIICVTESWLSQDIPSSLVCPSDYNAVRFDRSTKGGGVIVFIRKLLNFTLVNIPTEFSNIEIVCFDINLHNVSSRIIAYYRPPGYGHDALTYATNSVTLLKKLCSTHSDIYLLGDFNLPDIDWSMYHSPNNSVYNEFMNFINSYGLYQHVNCPTRNANTLDLVFTTSPSSISDLQSLPPISSSDHCVIIFTTQISSPLTSGESLATSRNWKCANFDAINYELSVINWNSVFQFCFDVQQCWNAFIDILNHICDKYVPRISSHRSRGSSKCRYPIYIRNLMQIKLAAWRQWNLSRSAVNKNSYATARRNCSTAIKKFHDAKELELIRKGNLRCFYKFVNSKTTCRSGISDIRCPDGSLTSDAQHKCEILNNYFSSVFTTDNGSSPTLVSRTPSANINLNAVEFTPHTVFSTLSKLKPSYSSDPDNITNILLKSCASALSIPLSHIFDTSFKDGVIPSSWKTASVTPIYKKGCTSDPNNYRPISLTSTCCKAMERIINASIHKYLASYHLISGSQHGFLSRRSTATNLLECITDWAYNIENRLVNDVIYFDFRKAFDSVSHPKLIDKLQAYGIKGHLLRWLSCFLTDRSQCVKIGDATSTPSRVTSGVPQGSVLGPTLFLIFINDLCDSLDDLDVKYKLFADDLKMYAPSKPNSVSSDMATALLRIESWCDTWQMNLAHDKCFCIRVCGKSSSSSPPSSYLLHNDPLKICNSVKDLGVVVDCHLNFSEHISAMIRKAMTRSRLILKCFSSRNHSLLVKAFTTYVRPLLEYCSVVWSPHLRCLSDKIESVQRHFTKRLPGLRAKPYGDRLSILGLQSLESRRVVFDLVLLYKITYGFTDSTLSSLLTVKSDLRTRGHDLRLNPLRFSNDTTKFLFINRSIALWNRLPHDTVHAGSPSSFKQSLLKSDLLRCC